MLGLAALGQPRPDALAIAFSLQPPSLFSMEGSVVWLGVALLGSALLFRLVLQAAFASAVGVRLRFGVLIDRAGASRVRRIAVVSAGPIASLLLAAATAFTVIMVSDPRGSGRPDVATAFVEAVIVPVKTAVRGFADILVPRPRAELYGPVGTTAAPRRRPGTDLAARFAVTNAALGLFLLAAVDLWRLILHLVRRRT